MNSPEDCLDCIKAGEELDAFVRGDLPLDDADRMRRHLNQCCHCADVARFEQAFRDRLKLAGKHDCCPDALKARIRDALERNRPDA